MFEAVYILIEEIRKHDDENKAKWIPDIFEVSSNILIGIIQDFNITVPTDFRIFT